MSKIGQFPNFAFSFADYHFVLLNDHKIFFDQKLPTHQMVYLIPYLGCKQQSHLWWHRQLATRERQIMVPFFVFGLSLKVVLGSNHLEGKNGRHDQICWWGIFYLCGVHSHGQKSSFLFIQPQDDGYPCNPLTIRVTWVPLMGVYNIFLAASTHFLKKITKI